MDRRYFLHREVFFCISGTDAVFCDVRTDDYIAFPMAVTSEFHIALVGWPSSLESQRDKGQIAAEETYETLNEMVARGLLTTNSAEGKEAVPFESPTPTSSLWDDHSTLSRPNVLRYVPSFFASARAAAGALRASVAARDIGPWKITLELIEAVRERRECSSMTWNADKARRLAEVARELRPWFNEAPVCTLDSLINIEFFARHSLYPEWVFGVQADPAQAHCWVQHDEMLINDTVDVVTQFTPIMAA